MKFNKTITKLVLSGTLVFFGSGCSDFLQEPDKSNFTLENYFTKPEHAESAVNSIYESLRGTLGGGFGGAPWMMLEFATGLANTELGQAQNSIFVRNLVNNSDNGYGQTYWTNNYRGIANANLAIAKIPDIAMNEATKKKYLGEARFLRALYYYDLVRIFGNIPLITEPINLKSPELYPDQATPEQVYKQIEADLVEAESSGLPYTDASGRASLGAVKSLLSSVYLTMAGYPLQKKEYFQKAADKAKEVIDSGKYSLFPTYDDLHNPVKKNIGENIFMVQFAAFVIPANWQTSIIPYNQGISAYTDETGAIFANKEFVESYAISDKRASEKQFYYRNFSLRSDRTKTRDLGGYYIYKLFDTEAQLSTTSSNLNWPVLRYAEVLLTYAEASNEAGGGPSAAAVEAVNKIRQRANLSPIGALSQGSFREEVWKQRWYELSFENKTWYDMARLRKAFNVSTKKFDDFVGHKFSYGPVLKERELLFPIPTAEIRNNSKLKQNPGY